MTYRLRTPRDRRPLLVGPHDHGGADGERADSAGHVRRRCKTLINYLMFEKYKVNKVNKRPRDLRDTGSRAPWPWGRRPWALGPL